MIPLSELGKLFEASLLRDILHRGHHASQTRVSRKPQGDVDLVARSRNLCYSNLPSSWQSFQSRSAKTRFAEPSHNAYTEDPLPKNENCDDMPQKNVLVAIVGALRHARGERRPLAALVKERMKSELWRVPQDKTSLLES